MNKFFIPTKNPEDWKWLLSEPDRLWKKGYSSKALAYCWHETNDFPPDVKKVFRKSGIPLFKNLKMLLALPEYKASSPVYSTRLPQNDIFVLAKGNNELISIMVDGKASEPFGDTVADLLKDRNRTKKKRLQFLLKKLQIENMDVDTIRYPILDRTAAALIEAEKFNAQNALILIHSFSWLNRWLRDFKRFVSLFGMKGKVNSISGPVVISGINLYFGWVRGDKKYLEK